MKKALPLLDELRSGLSPLENHLIDGVVDGRVSRREFMRHGSVIGLSLPFLGRVALTAGVGASPTLARANVQPGATIRIACDGPIQAVDPIVVGDTGGIVMIQQVGEFLCIDGTDLVLKPCLATSWKPNQDGTVWTFLLRKGVKFHSGSEMTADDVVATFDRLTDPNVPSPAGSVFSGFLRKGGTRKVDDYTVAFHLDAPNGNFPYLVSSDNYNAIILRASFAGNFEQNWDGTGPFKIEKFTARVGASFVRNENYWGPKALPARTQFVFFTDIQPQILAFQSGEVDVILKLPALAGVSLLNDPTVDIISVESAAHEAVSMRCDTGPFKDPRVRQAVALCLDREKLVQGLMRGHAIIGNDSPFASIYPSTDQTVPQRKRDIARAKELMKAAGMEKGFQAPVVVLNWQEIPQYAQLIQAWVKEIDIDLKLNIMNWKSAIGDRVFGRSPWLDSAMSFMVWGARGVPNFYLSSILRSEGPRNAAHFKNTRFDTLASSYIAAIDFEAQRATAGEIQRLLLEETPQLYGYFFSQLAAVKKGIVGIETDALSHLFLQSAGKA
ncbi:ABC transporter substrate-binding protein [Bradyrhizobium sp. 25ACV]